MSDRAYLSIGEVLSLLKPEFADLTISKIRFLESQGLLDPERTPSGYRKFYEADVDRLRWILRQQHENYLPLKVIKGKLGGEADGDGEAPAAPGRSELAVEHFAEPVAAPSPRGGTSLTAEELAASTGLSEANVSELVRFGLVAGKTVGGTVYYDADALAIANIAAGFMRYGVEARHLRMYRTAAEREAGFFEQVVMPMVKQRNPDARRQAVDALRDLSRLGQGLRAAMLRMALREITGP